MVQRFTPEHLTLEDAAKVAGGGVDRSLHRRLAVRIGFQLEARDLPIGDTAGDDPLEVAEVGGDV